MTGRFHVEHVTADAVDGLLGHEGPDAALADAVGEIHGADVLAALIPALG